MYIVPGNCCMYCLQVGFARTVMDRTSHSLCTLCKLLLSHALPLSESPSPAPPPTHRHRLYIQVQHLNLSMRSETSGLSHLSHNYPLSSAPSFHLPFSSSNFTLPPTSLPSGSTLLATVQCHLQCGRDSSWSVLCG